MISKESGGRDFRHVAIEVARSVTHSVTPRSRASAHLQHCQWLSVIGAVRTARAGPPRLPAFLRRRRPGPRTRFLLSLSLPPAAEGSDIHARKPDAMALSALQPLPDCGSGCGYERIAGE